MTAQPRRCHRAPWPQNEVVTLHYGWSCCPSQPVSRAVVTPLQSQGFQDRFPCPTLSANCSKHDRGNAVHRVYRNVPSLCSPALHFQGSFAGPIPFPAPLVYLQHIPCCLSSAPSPAQGTNCSNSLSLSANPAQSPQLLGHCQGTDGCFPAAPPLKTPD